MGKSFFVYLTSILYPIFCLAQSQNIEWELVHVETFNSPIVEPTEWVEDTYGDTSQWNVDIFDEDGDFFRDQFGERFDTTFAKFRSFRKSFTYGEDGWLTFELYGRDEDKDGHPESGGKFINDNGKAKLICQRHTDAGIIRTTDELPEIYRIEVTVSNVNFGGDQNLDGDWNENGKFNGYDGDELASPWRMNWWKTEWLEAWHENGVYFACITDFANPAPHNNVFWHHHRKVVMDTDNNNYDGTSWSYVYNPNSYRFVEDGNMFTDLIWLNGENFGEDMTGNYFLSWTPAGWQTEEGNTNFADKYLPHETYTFMIERTPEYYTMSVSGKFYYGGETTYKASKKVDEYPVVWHYNRNEPYDGSKNQILTYNGKTINTWPANSYYPDYFFCGDPHINFYEGSAEFDDIKLWRGHVKTGITKNENKTLFQIGNYPNPFSKSTSITFTLNNEADVNLKIYNVIGQLVGERLLHNCPRGKHSWTWTKNINSAPGMYFCVISVKSGTERKVEILKMVNIR